MYWQVEMKTAALDASVEGSHIFTYNEHEAEDRFTARARAIQDAHTTAAIRHRKGMELDLDSLTVTSRGDDLCGA